MSLTAVFWVVAAATVLLIMAGCPRKAAPVFIIALLALLTSATAIL